MTVHFPFKTKLHLDPGGVLVVKFNKIKLQREANVGVTQ